MTHWELLLLPAIRDAPSLARNNDVMHKHEWISHSPVHFPFDLKHVRSRDQIKKKEACPPIMAASSSKLKEESSSSGNATRLSYDVVEWSSYSPGYHPR